jgi:hypothetical protein
MKQIVPIGSKERSMRIAQDMPVIVGGLLLLTCAPSREALAQSSIASAHQRSSADTPESVFVGYVYQLPKKINFSGSKC